MTTASAAIVQRLWNYCNLLRGGGISYGDHVEQLTSLLLLKMAHERKQPLYSQPPRIPADYDWQSLLEPDEPQDFSPRPCLTTTAHRDLPPQPIQNPESRVRT